MLYSGGRHVAGDAILALDIRVENVQVAVDDSKNAVKKP